MFMKNEGTIGHGKSGGKQQSVQRSSIWVGEGVGHASKSDSSLISAIWSDFMHTCVACTSPMIRTKVIQILMIVFPTNPLTSKRNLNLEDSPEFFKWHKLLH